MSFLLPLRTRASHTELSGASRTMIEPLEDRQFFSAAPAIAGLDVPLKTQSVVFANMIAKNGVSSMLPLHITGVSVQDGQLVANATLGSHAFTIPLTLTTSPAASEGLAAAATTD